MEKELNVENLISYLKKELKGKKSHQIDKKLYNALLMNWELDKELKEREKAGTRTQDLSKVYFFKN